MARPPLGQVATVGFQAGHTSTLLQIARALCAAVGRCGQPMAAAVAVTVAVIRAARPRRAPSHPACGPGAPPLPNRTVSCRLHSLEVSRADSRDAITRRFPLASLRSHRPLTPYRRRITIRRSLVGSLCTFPVTRAPGPSPGLARGLTAALVSFPVRVLVDQVVTVNRGDAACLSAGDGEHGDIYALTP